MSDDKLPITTDPFLARLITDTKLNKINKIIYTQN